MLQIPVIKAAALKRALAAVGPRPPLLGPPCTPSADDPLDVLLQRVGSLLGKDPTVWEQTGAAQACAAACLQLAARGAGGG